MKYETLRKWLLFWSAFIGLGAYWGAAMMFIDPTGAMWGMEPLLPMLRRLPFSDFFFRDFIWSGVVLLCVNGLTNTVAFALLLKRHRLASPACIGCGAVLVVWIVAEFFIFGFNPLSDIYLVFGLVQFGTGVWAFRTERRQLGN